MDDTTTTPAIGADTGNVESAIADVAPVSDRRRLATSGMGLAWFAKDAPDRMAIISDDGNRTYAELNGRANQLIRAIRRLGVGQGDSLGLACSNRPEFPETLAASARGGLRTTPINWHLTGEEMAYILGDCEAKVLVADARFAAACHEAAALTPGLVVKLAVGGPIEGFEDYDAALAVESAEDIDDPVAGRQMLYTSGTTGRPKGVTRAGVDRAAAAGSADAAVTPAADSVEAASNLRQRMVPGDVHLLTGPAYHAAPLAMSLQGPLASGITVVMMDGWEPERTLALIAEHKVTSSHLVPTMFHRLLALPDDVKAKYDLSSLRAVRHGAAPCPVEVKKGMIDWWGPVIFEYYAATEGGGTAVGPEEWLTKPGTVGRPTAGRTVEVWDDDGNKLPAGEVGTVYFKAPAGGRFAYHKDEAKTAGAYKSDFFTLGDMGYFDEDDYLFLTGRSADLIISGGVNIYPVEVDAVLLQHPAVADVATVGVPSEDWGEEVKSVVLLKPGVDPSDAIATELIAFTRDHLAHFKCPRSVDFVDELPRHDTGKIYRRLVRDRYWEGLDKQI